MNRELRDHLTVAALLWPWHLILFWIYDRWVG